MALSEPVRTTALVAFATAFSFVLFRGATTGPSSGRATSPDDAAPAGAFLVASLDLEQLRATHVLDPILGTASLPRTVPVPGVSAAADACGFDPLARVKRATISVPEEDDGRGDFGLSAQVDITSAELRTCVTRIEEKRGAPASKREEGSFVVLDAPSPDAGAARGPTPSLAYGAGGLLLVGQGGWLSKMMRAADGKHPSVSADAAHGALRGALGGAGWERPMVLVSMVLPRALRDRLRGEMAAEVSAADPSAAAMGGVLGVSSAGLAMRRVLATGRIEARAELVCDDGPSCDAVQRLLGKKRLDWSKDLALRLLGVGPLLDSVELERPATPGPARVQVRASADAAALAATVDRILRLGGPGRGPAERAEPSGPPGLSAPPGHRSPR